MVVCTCTRSVCKFKYIFLKMDNFSYFCPKSTKTGKKFNGTGQQFCSYNI